MDLAKDQSKLAGVSKHFTEEVLEKILRESSNGKNAEILSWTFKEASAKGDSYLSTVNKIKVTGIVDGKQEQISLVVKSIPQNKGRRNTFRSAEFFHNEIVFYTKIVPLFEKFLHEKGQKQLLCIPRYVASVMDGENDYIALEDVSTLGYGPVLRQSCVDESQCAMMMKAMAKFHAISFGVKDQKKEEFEKAMEYLQETYFSEKLWNWYKKFHRNLLNIAKNALDVEYNNSEAAKRFSSYKFGYFFEKCTEFCSRKYAPTSVITQGDSWAPNFLVKDSNGEQKALMLDFQLARCASPVLDLSFCIYSCTDNDLQQKYFDKMLKVYHDELSASISLLGSDPDKIYPWNTFMDEVKEQFMFGLTFALEAVPFTTLDESESFDLDNLIKTDEAVDIADVWVLSNIKNKSGRLRLANFIVHAAERGFI